MTPHSDFAILSFQPTQILLLHRPTRTIYDYHESTRPPLPEAQHPTPALMRPVRYGQGFLLPKVKSSLENELQGRRRAHTPLPFQEQQILNTFQPIVQSLLALHASDLVFGCFSPGNIVITQGDEVMLREKWIDPKESTYYLHKDVADVRKEDDWLALADIILQTATLKKSSKLSHEKQLPAIVQGLMDRFSKGFLFALCILLKKNKEKIPLIINYLKNEQKSLTDPELNALYNSVKTDRERRRAPTVTNQNICQNVPTNKPISFSVHQSPLRKVMAVSFGNTLRKISKEDSENKKTPGQLRARKSDRINKIIEKSNEFAMDMLSKKNKEALTKIAPKPNIANISLFSSELFRRKTKEPTPTVAPSPGKNIRSVSRKK